MMKLAKKYRLSILILIALSKCGTASANELGHGRISMEGSIVDTPCAININSRDQSLDIGILNPNDIVRNAGEGVPLTIKLINCTLGSPKRGKIFLSKFSITFDSPSTNSGLFSLDGDAKGIGLQITDSDGQHAIPGVPLKRNDINVGDSTLKYTLRIIGNNQQLRAGEFWSVVRFKLDYY